MEWAILLSVRRRLEQKIVASNLSMLLTLVATLAFLWATTVMEFIEIRVLNCILAFMTLRLFWEVVMDLRRTKELVTRTNRAIRAIRSAHGA